MFPSYLSATKEFDCSLHVVMERDVRDVSSAAELHRIGQSMVMENATLLEVETGRRSVKQRSLDNGGVQHEHCLVELGNQGSINCRSRQNGGRTIERQISSKQRPGPLPAPLPREDSSTFDQETPNFERLYQNDGRGEIAAANRIPELGEPHCAVYIVEESAEGDGAAANTLRGQQSSQEQKRRRSSGPEESNGMNGSGAPTAHENGTLGGDAGVGIETDGGDVHGPNHMPLRGGAMAVLAPLRIMRLKSRSRMADPHPFEVQAADAARSRPLPAPAAATEKPEGVALSMRKSGAVKKSGFIVSSNLPPVEEEEEDPFMFDESDIKNARGCTFCGFLQLVILLLLVGCLFFTLYVGTVRNHYILGLEPWKWVVLALTLFSGRLVSGWIVGITARILERKLLAHRRLLYFIYGLRRGVRNVIWAFMVWIMYDQLFSHPVQGSKDTNVRKLVWLGQLLLCYVVGACIWLVKILLLKLLALNFHVSTYFERIQSALYNQYLVETLSTPPEVDDYEDETFDDPIAAGWSMAGAGGGHGPWNGTPGSVPTDDSKKNPKVERSPSQWSSWLSWNGRRRRSRKAVSHDEETISLSTIVESEKEEKSGQSARVVPGSLSRRNVPHAETPRSAASKSRRSDLVRDNKAGKSRREQSKEAPIPIHRVQNLTQQHITPWSMKRLVHMVRMSGVSIYPSSLADSDELVDGQDVEIQNELQAKQAAKQIFTNLAMPGQRCITLEDLRRVLTSNEVEKVFALFDGAMESGKITRKSLKNWVVNVYRERRALSLSLNDSRTAIKKLQRIVDTVLSIGILIISLLILRIATTQVLVLISSQLLLVVFIFGNTCKTIFEAIIFVFVTHPFDVGDRCIIDDKQYVVEEMNILQTVFLAANNDKVYFPNSLLATKPIANLYRSPDEGDGYSFYIASSTTGEKLAALKDRLQKYINGHPHAWHPDPFFFVADIVSGQQMKCTLGLSHACNGQDQRSIVTHRHDLIVEVHRQLTDLGISYQPTVQDVRITSLVGSLTH